MGPFCDDPLALPPPPPEVALYLMLGENSLMTSEQTRSFSNTRNWKENFFKLNVMKLDIVDECLKGTPHDQEVMGSNLVRGWAYSLSPLPGAIKFLCPKIDFYLRSLVLNELSWHRMDSLKIFREVVVVVAAQVVKQLTLVQRSWGQIQQSAGNSSFLPS